MIMACHVSNEEIVSKAFYDPTIFPLNHPTTNHFVPIENEIMKMEGCHLFYDNECGEYVRSGKANREAGDSFRQRLDDHEKAAHLKTQENRNSKFYLSHPTGKIGTKGKHERL